MPSGSRKKVISPAESAAAFGQLGALQPRRAPGAGGATMGQGSGKLHGRYATARFDLNSLFPSSLTFNAHLWLFDWEISLEQEFADGTAHGEYWDNPVPLKMMWTGTARMYMNSLLPPANAGQPDYILWQKEYNSLYVGFRGPGDPAQCRFQGYNAAPLTANRQIFDGLCYVTRASFSAPREGMAVQEVQLRGVGAPTFGVLNT